MNDYTNDTTSHKRPGGQIRRYGASNTKSIDLFGYGGFEPGDEGPEGFWRSRQSRIATGGRTAVRPYIIIRGHHVR